MKVRVDDLTDPGVAEFLREHLEDMAQHSPPESVHVLDLERLRKPDITFWTAWDKGELLGTGALKELDPRHGEIKSMRTATGHRKQGVASTILTVILKEAKRRNYTRVSLETGSPAAFMPARSLYAKFGFRECGPFDGYADDPYSVFMTKEL